MEVDKQRIAALVKKIQSSDDSAFDELYKLTSERAYFVALEFTKNNQDAEDILQESYVKALSKINELEKAETFSSWLNQIVANKSKDFLKKKKPMLFEAEENEVLEVIPDEDTDFSPEDSLDKTELQKTVMEVLDELSEEKRACILMMYFEDLSVGEIARTLEIPEGTVKTRLYFARKDLKEKFSKRGVTSAFSVAPIGVVIWALRMMSDAIAETFVGSGASAKVLGGISAAGAGTAAGATATAAGATAATTAASGTGFAAKIAALTAAQKIIAGACVTAVVAGGTVGVVSVTKNKDKEGGISTTAYTEEYTTAPSFETTAVFEAMGTVEFSQITESATAEVTAAASVSGNSTASAGETLPTPSESVSATGKETTTAPSTTARQTTATTEKQTETTKKETTAKATTTKRQLPTRKPSTTKKASTTRKATTTKKPAATQKPATTQKPSTTKESTTVTKPTQPPTTTAPTTEATTLADPIINVTYYIPEDPQPYSYPPFTVAPGTVIDDDLVYYKILNDESLGFVEVAVDSGEYSDSAESGKTYNFVVVGMYE